MKFFFNTIVNPNIIQGLLFTNLNEENPLIVNKKNIKKIIENKNNLYICDNKLVEARNWDEYNEIKFFLTTSKISFIRWDKQEKLSKIYDFLCIKINITKIEEMYYEGYKLYFKIENK